MSRSETARCGRTMRLVWSAFLIRRVFVEPNRDAEDEFGLSQHCWPASVDATMDRMAGGVAVQGVADAFGRCHQGAVGAGAQIGGRQQRQCRRIGPAEACEVAVQPVLDSLTVCA